MTISQEQIKKALINSGYLLEDRVNKVLEKNDWQTIPNSRFQDINTRTEREMDIVALKNINDLNENIDQINSALLIECMNNKEPIAYFENLKKQPNRFASLNYNVFNKNFSNILYWAQQELNSKLEIIYSSQYCGFQRVQKLIKVCNDGWIASHPDRKHDSETSLFQYIKYHINEFQNHKNTDEFITGCYYRPLIVLQGELLSIQQKEELTIIETNRIKFQIPKTDNNGRYFLIDIITESYLPEYLKLIAIEDEKIWEITKKHREKLIE